MKLTKRTFVDELFVNLPKMDIMEQIYKLRSNLKQKVCIGDSAARTPLFVHS